VATRFAAVPQVMHGQQGTLLVLVGAASAVSADMVAAPAGGGLAEFLLTLFGVMISAATAVLAAVCARLSHSAQLAWLALLLGGYSLVVLPLASGILHPLAYWGGGTLESGPAVVFAALRLLALLVTAAGVIVLAGRSHRAVQLSRGELADRLACAEEARRRLAAEAAYRDYEIRSGLSGLSGISELVRTAPAMLERERLRAAVDGELTRLRGILDGANPWTCGREPGAE
jgi:signal transduction histidine kinase